MHRLGLLLAFCLLLMFCSSGSQSSTMNTSLSLLKAELGDDNEDDDDDSGHSTKADTDSKDASHRTKLAITTANIHEKVEHFSHYIELIVAALILLVLLVTVGLCMWKYCGKSTGGSHATRSKSRATVRRTSTRLKSKLRRTTSRRTRKR